MIKKQFFIIISFFLFVPISFQAEAKVYRCLDENGKQIYKNSPCAEDQKSKTVINTDRSGTEYSKDYYFENEEYPEFNKQKKKKYCRC